MTIWTTILLEYQTMDKVQKLSSLDCNTPSSEPFRIDVKITVFWDVEEDPEDSDLEVKIVFTI
jgi:hypothetical protein